MLDSTTRHHPGLRKALVPIILLIATTAFGVPATPVDYSDYPHLVKFIQSPGKNYDVVACSVFGRDYFVYANKNTGLNVVEIEGGNVVPRGTVQLPGFEVALAVKDWNIFALSTSGSIYTVSLVDPDNPTDWSSFPLLPGEPSRLVVENDRLYVPSGTAGLALFDIGPGGDLTYGGNWGANITAMSADGNRVAVITDGRMDLLDFTDLAAPVLLGSSTSAISRYLSEVILAGDIAWVGHSSGTTQLDISTPNAMTSLASNSYAGRLSINGGDLVVDGGFFFDFTTGTAKLALQSIARQQVAFIADHMVGIGSDKIVVYRDGERAFAPSFGDFPIDNDYLPAGFAAEDVLVTYERASVNYVGLAAFEIGGDGSFLWRLDLQVGPQESLMQYCRRGSLAAVLSRDGQNEGSTGVLRLIDVSRHGAVARGTLMPANMFVYIRSTMAFLDHETLLILETYDNHYDGPHYLRVIDVSDPDFPVELDRVLLNLTRADRIDVSGDLVLVAGGLWSEIVLAPDRLSLQPTGAGFGGETFLRGRKLFTRSGTFQFPLPTYYHLDTYDLTDPLAPILIGSLAMETSNDLVVGEDWAVQENTGTVFDLKGPGGAVVTGNHAPNMGLRLQDPLANSEFVMYRHNSADLLKFMSAPGAQGLVSAVGDEPPRPFDLTLSTSPNPFNPRVKISFELTREAPVVLRVFDMRGHVVANLVSERLSAGVHGADWDGRDEAGRAVAAGVYFASITCEGAVSSRKITLIK